jgi:hypothetical protein
MRDSRAISELRQALTASGLNLSHLDPWEAWRGFKTFLHREVEGSHDAASVQWGVFSKDAINHEEATLLLVRQFTERAELDGEDELVGRIVVELCYSPEGFRTDEPLEVWTHDYPTLEEWASVVEGAPQFQACMAGVPTATDVYYDEDSEGDIDG